MFKGLFIALICYTDQCKKTVCFNSRSHVVISFSGLFLIIISRSEILIKSFIHKGLERFYRTGRKAGIQAKHAKRLRLILSNLDQAESPEEMDLPGLMLHELKGNRKGVWAVKVSGNWRVTFRFISHDAEIVNYEDYH